MGKWHKRALRAAAVIGVIALAGWLWLKPATAPEKLIFTGGPIVTMNPLQPTAEALYVNDGRIAGVGTLAAMRAVAEGSGGADEVDMNGASLMPGLIEPHSHPIAAAQFAATIDASGFAHKNRAEVMQTLREGVTDSTRDWVLAFGWDPVMIDDLEPPTLAELDALSPDKPLLILTQMMHDAYANSAAMEAAGIVGDVANPPAGEFVRDENGLLTGTVREVGAIGVLFSAMPPPPAGANDLLLSLFFADYAKAGYTTVATMGPVGNDADPISLLKRRAGNPHSPVQTIIYGLPHQITASQTPEANAATAPVVGVKFWMDGSPYAGGAAVADPYETTPLTTERLHLKPGHRGAVMIPVADYEAQFADYHARGFQIATHVQGEMAVERVLDVAERVLAANPRADHRHRLEHNALITAEQLARAHALDITTSFFIDHVRFYGDKLPALFGQERTERYMPIGTALRAGHRVTVHSDTPATPIGPLSSLVTMLARQPNSGGPVVGAGETLSREQALRALTINGARQLGLESERGSLEVGKQADLVMLSSNLVTVPVNEIENTVVLGTWINGQPVDTRKATLTNAGLLWDIVVGMIF